MGHSIVVISSLAEGGSADDIPVVPISVEELGGIDGEGRDFGVEPDTYFGVTPGGLDDIPRPEALPERKEGGGGIIAPFGTMAGRVGKRRRHALDDPAPCEDMVESVLDSNKWRYRLKWLPPFPVLFSTFLKWESRLAFRVFLAEVKFSSQTIFQRPEF